MSCLLFTVLTAPLAAQAGVRLTASVPFHAGPDGVLLGNFDPGVTVVPGRVQGSWREVLLEAWVWTPSTGPTTRDGFNLVITQVGGENLRRAPNQDRVARALEGVLLNRVRTQGGWTLVRRAVWVPVASLPAAARPQATPPPPPPPAAAPPTGPPTPVTVPADGPVRSPAGRARQVTEVGRVRRNATVSLGPGMDQVGRLPQDLDVDVLERAGGWVKVRADVWVREEDVGPALATAADAVTLSALQADPERFVGRTVTWRLQYLSVQTADELRPELPAGQPYVLTRGPLPEAGFVYVAVTRDQAARFRGMQPLDEFVARGTLLAARTRYLPTPVLQLEAMP